MSNYPAYPQQGHHSTDRFSYATVPPWEYQKLPQQGGHLYTSNVGYTQTTQYAMYQTDVNEATENKEGCDGNKDDDIDEDDEEWYVLEEGTNPKGRLLKWDPYDVLGVVNREAEVDDIRKLWKKLIFETHPDQNHGSGRTKTSAMAKLNAAWEILNDELKRKYFNEHRRVPNFGAYSPEEATMQSEQSDQEQEKEPEKQSNGLSKRESGRDPRRESKRTKSGPSSNSKKNPRRDVKKVSNGSKTDSNKGSKKDLILLKKNSKSELRWERRKDHKQGREKRSAKNGWAWASFLTAW